MGISADMERVFEIGPIFRAEKSQTGRHLTEFTGVDLEMALDEKNTGYLDVVHLISDMLLEIIRRVEKHSSPEISKIRTVERLYTENVLIMTFREAANLLRQDGID